jgi:hypothetical protein
VPGTYVVRLVLGTTTVQQSLIVKPDPRDEWTQAQYQAGYDYARKYNAVYSTIDETLNDLDAIKSSLASAATAAKSDPALEAQIADAQRRWQPVFAAFTADYKNDEDSIQRAGSLRESIPRTTGLGGPQLPPTAAQLDYSKRFDDAYAAAMNDYNTYVASLGPLQAALKKAGLKPLAGTTAVTP